MSDLEKQITDEVREKLAKQIEHGIYYATNGYCNHAIRSFENIRKLLQIEPPSDK